MTTLAIEITNMQIPKMDRERAARTKTYHPTPLAGAIAAGYAELARALVRRALRDAMGKDLPPQSGPEYQAQLQAEAQEWLVSPEGLGIAEYGGFDVELIQRWTAAGCPAPKR